MAVPGGVSYLLHDQFTTADAAPITTPRTCEPGPGTALIRDLDSVTRSESSWLEWLAQTDGSPGYARQDIVFDTPVITRAAGQIIMCKWRCTTDGAHYPLALVSSTTPTWDHTHVVHGFYSAGSATPTLQSVDGAALGVPLFNFVAGGPILTEYWLAMILQGSSCYYYVQGGAFTTLNFCRFSQGSITTTPLRVASAGYAAVFSTTMYRVPQTLYTGDLVAES